jgi:hypothetical protein
MSRLRLPIVLVAFALARCDGASATSEDVVPAGTDAADEVDAPTPVFDAVDAVDAVSPEPDMADVLPPGPDTQVTALGVTVVGLPDRTPLGAPVTVTAQVTADAPAGLTIQWSATCGSFSSTAGAAVTWIAPAAVQRCDVTAVATAEGTQASAVATTRATNATKLVAADAIGDGTAAGFDMGSYYYGVVGGTLFVEVDLTANDFSTSQFEVFLLQTAANQEIHSFGMKAGAVMFWQANRPAGHPHYHWQQVTPPARLHFDATDPHVFSADVALADVGLEAQVAIRTGVAGAPTTVAQTASYTDRLPDALLVTGTDVEGLQTVSVP